MYVIKKPLNLRGKRRVTGEIIQESDIDKKRVYSLVSAGYIAQIDRGLLDTAEMVQHTTNIQSFQPQKDCIVPIIKREGTMVISVASESISEVFRLIQTTVNEAVSEIENIDDENILIILDACDSRKAIKEAAKKRSEILHAEKGDEKGLGNEGES